MGSKTFLITGIYGFLGRKIAKSLISNDLFKVYGFVREIREQENIKGVQYLSSLTEVNNLNIDFIIHTATNYGKNGDSIKSVMDSNVILPCNLIGVVLESSENKGFNFINIDTVLPPETSLYSLTKNKFKEIFQSSILTSQLNFYNLRLDHFYGPKGPKHNFINFLIQKLKLNEPNIELTKGHQKRDFLFIDDLVEAIALVIANIVKGNNISSEIVIASGTSVTIRKVVELLKEKVNSHSNLNFGALPYRENEIMFSNNDISYISSLGWQPKTTLTEGLMKTIKES